MVCNRRRLDESCVAAHLGERAVRQYDADGSSVLGGPHPYLPGGTTATETGTVAGDEGDEEGVMCDV